MATTTQVSAVDETYEGIQLETRDWDKMITFIDQLLFHLRVTQTKARPVAIRESKGVVEIRWQGRVPKAFRPGRYGLLCISRGRWMDSFTVQRAA
jgi:hypothetical protein